MDSEYVKMRRAECSGAMERLRREILEFLAVDDRNGRYTDAQCEAEGADPLSFEDAMELLSDAYRERMVPAWGGASSFPSSNYRVTALQAEARTHRRMAAKALKCRQSDLLPAMPPTVRVHETGATLVTGWERGSDGVQTQISTAL